MDNPKFDPSLLKSADEKTVNAPNNNFQNQLKPVNDNEEDPGAYLDNLSTDEGFFHKLPRNILIGLAKLGHSTLNMPHDIAEVAEKRLTQPAEQMNKNFGIFSEPTHKNLKISDYIPKQQDYDFSSMLGQKGEPGLMDNLIQKGVEYSPALLSAPSLLRGGFRRLIGTHELDSVRNAVHQLGINNFSYTPEVIEEARRYLPNTEATRQLFEKSNAGDYTASDSMRSQLSRHQHNLSNSPLAAERLLAPQVGDLKNTMLNQLQNGLREQGLDTEADMLPNGIRKYAQYKRIKKAVLPIVEKVGIPTTFASLVGYGYSKGKKLANG